jgi:sugar phosphate isomerase/epimerase
MTALSTSYIDILTTSGADIIKRLAALGVSEVELSYKINEEIFLDIRDAISRSKLQVCSVHNFFPIPSTAPNGKGGGDVFLLSHPDDEQRRIAVQWTKRSIERASEVGAKALVVHCGRVDMNAEHERLCTYFSNRQLHSPEGKNLIRRKLRELEAVKSAYLESVQRSLEDLIPTAEQNNIILGLENRYHYHELPGPEDFEVIFEKFASAPIGYWHDTGHAHAQEALGLFPAEELLRRYHQKLVGVHVHDALGLDDHFPPGAGEIDFKKIATWIGDDVLRVIELKQGTPDNEVASGIHYLRETLEL